MKKHYLLILVALLSFAGSAQIVNIPDANFKAKLLNHSPSIDTNGDSEIQVSEALNTTQLLVAASNISNLTGIQAFTNLIILDVDDNNLSTIDVTGLTSLSTFTANSNQLTSVNLGNINNLYTLGLSNNQLTTIDLSGKTIVVFGCMNNLLTNINLIGADIQELRCPNNPLTQLNISHLPNLTELNCSNNQITSLDFSANAILTTVNCTMNPITHIDFSKNPLLFEVACLNNQVLESLNIKNGNSSTVSLDYLSDAPNLRFVCTDDEDIATIASNFAGFGFPLAHVSSYCSFSPGGKFNTIAGSVRHDLGNDGCTATDPVIAGLRINISNATGGGGAVFTDSFGKYRFFTSIGDFTVEPVSAGPFHIFTPAAPIISFLNDNHNVVAQNFCLTSSGVHQDLEITMFSTIPARPGFDALYILQYRNKGTETMSGTVNLQFNDNLMDFDGSIPAIGTQGVGTLDWAFTNLVPLETRSISVTMNINSPTETPAVNIGDALNFTATVFPIIGDETPVDNVFQFQQIVVGSFDPNDITCQEGTTIGVEQVGEYLHYLIRFQNSGNFYAENVVVKNIINDPNFDLSTFELIGTSHNHETRLTGNVLEFIFEGINLPAEVDDEPGSHGYIAYKIKTTNGLGIGDWVSQLADIYFDFNFPIITNTAVTTVTALGTKQFDRSLLAIYPNPAKTAVTVSADGLINVSLYDLQGRLLESQPTQSEKYTLDISKRSSGLYLLRIETVTGVRTERLVKE